MSFSHLIVQLDDRTTSQGRTEMLARIKEVSGIIEARALFPEIDASRDEIGRTVIATLSPSATTETEDALRRLDGVVRVTDWPAVRHAPAPGTAPAPA